MDLSLREPDSQMVRLEQGQALEYAKTLYETYVLDDADDWSPADALAEDMSYWGD